MWRRQLNKKAWKKSWKREKSKRKIISIHFTSCFVSDFCLIHRMSYTLWNSDSHSRSRIMNKNVFFFVNYFIEIKFSCHFSFGFCCCSSRTLVAFSFHKERKKKSQIKNNSISLFSSSLSVVIDMKQELGPDPDQIANNFIWKHVWKRNTLKLQARRGDWQNHLDCVNIYWCEIMIAYYSFADKWKWIIWLGTCVCQNPK